jgi:cytochrome c oxidase subunit 6b
VVCFFCCKVEKRKRETIPLSPPRRERRNRDFGRKQEEEEERASFLQKGEKNAMLILLTRFFKLSLSLIYNTIQKQNEEEQVEEEEVAAEEEPEQEEEASSEDIVVKTTPFDPRFPQQNQAKHCYTRYNEYHKCAAEKGEEECASMARLYRSICPGEWVEKWNEERDNGTWPGRY